MPSAFTVDLYEGKKVTFEEFVMKCALALIPMCGEKPDTSIPEKLKPSSHLKEELEEAQQRLVEIKSWDNVKAEKEAEKAYQEVMSWRNKVINKNITVRKRYEGMLAKVQAWIPPTPDHIRLKDFMIKHLKDNIKSDCGYTPDEPVKISGAEYKAQRIAEAQREVNDCIEEYKEDVKRVQESNEWLKALRESLHS